MEGSSKRRRSSSESKHIASLRKQPKRETGGFRCLGSGGGGQQHNSTAYPLSTHCQNLLHCRCSIKHPVDPQFLIGKRVSVRWDEADGWYNGTVNTYTVRTCKHSVSGGPHAKAC